jgi:dUTPase
MFFESVNYIEYGTNLFIAPQDEEEIVGFRRNENPNPIESHDITWHARPRHYFVQNYPRSSISRYNLVLANSVGTIDGGYRGQIFCRFKYIFQPEDLRIERERIIGGVNLSKIYQQGDKIVQMIVQQTNPILFETIEELPESLRNTGGFGSSGV